METGGSPDPDKLNTDTAEALGRLQSWFAWIWTDISTHSQGSRNDKITLGYVAIVTAVFSLFPLAINIAGSGYQPLEVGSGVVLGITIFFIVARRLHPISDLSIRAVIRQCRMRTPRRTTLLIIALSLAPISYFAFVLSTALITTATSTAIYATLPILWFTLASHIDRYRVGPSEHPVISWETHILIILTPLAGYLLVIASQLIDDPFYQNVDAAVFGTILAVAAPVLGSLAVSNLLFVDSFLSSIVDGPSKDRRLQHFKTHQLEEYVAATGVAVGGAFASIACAVLLAYVFWESYVLLPGILTGGLVGAPLGLAILLMLRVHFANARQEIVSLQYVSPLLALFCLANTIGIDVRRMDSLILGTLFVVVISMMIYTDPPNTEESSRTRRTKPLDRPLGTPYRTPKRHGLRVLVLSLLLIGILVHYRNEIFFWYEWPAGVYWPTLAVVSTVFALLYSFRLRRMESLLADENRQTAELIRRIEVLPSVLFHDQYQTRKMLMRSVGKIGNETAIGAFQRPYLEAHQFFQQLARRIATHHLTVTLETQREISTIRSKLDALSYGRQRDHDFAEQIALWLIGTSIVVLTLFPPVWNSWDAGVAYGNVSILTDGVAIVLGAVVCFLLVHLADIARSRNTELFETRYEDSQFLPDELRIRFRPDENTMWRRIFVAVLISTIIITIVTFMAWKRLWF